MKGCLRSTLMCKESRSNRILSTIFEDFDLRYSFTIRDYCMQDYNLRDCREERKCLSTTLESGAHFISRSKNRHDLKHFDKFSTANFAMRLFEFF